jgi:putative ABC transport system ATP-binding protein
VSPADTLVEPRTAVGAVCTGVVKIYLSDSGEVHALKGIDAIFPGDQITALVGPSGSGKSSLLRILACIDPPTAGQVRVADVEVQSLKPRRRRAMRRRLIGYMFQRPSDNLIPYLTASDHLETSAKLRGVGADGRADELLETLGLQGRGGHRPEELSGGEQQRLALATAVIGDPALVVADEPTAELDSRSAGQLMDMVVALRERGTGFVLATHDPIVMRAADQILHLRHGSLEAETRSNRALAVIDTAGRVQLPPDALKLFPGRRAEIRLEDGEVRITPP